MRALLQRYGWNKAAVVVGDVSGNEQFIKLWSSTAGDVANEKELVFDEEALLSILLWRFINTNNVFSSIEITSIVRLSDALSHIRLNLGELAKTDARIFLLYATDKQVGVYRLRFLVYSHQASTVTLIAILYRRH